MTSIQYRILRWISPGEPNGCSGVAYVGKSKMSILLGDDLLRRIAGKFVIDFGCGGGSATIELAKSGAQRVLGIDIREDLLEAARASAVAAGVENACDFATSTDEIGDIIVSIDAFEHFEDPAGVLGTMSKLLPPGGEVLASFGPTWYHPLGGHLFSIFPWSHLLFSERALIQWRSDFKTDGATCFGEVAGGLNRMTIGRFERLVEHSPFELAMLEAVPIRRLRRLHNRCTREFATAIVRCRLVKRL